MNDFGLITARDPKGEFTMTDVIHKVLMILLLMNGQSLLVVTLTRMSKGVAFGADSGTVALALATGELQCQFQNQLSYFQRRYENLYGFP
jgi:aconitate hydratase 2/2-methylisocitrate dehydratase